MHFQRGIVLSLSACSERCRCSHEMTTRTFAPGFRISLLDMAVLAIGAIATVALAVQTWWWGFIVGFVLAHFFLFCNVFRMARSSELVWAAVFVVLAGGTIVQDVPGWGLTAAISLGVTVVVVILEMRKPSYHGIAWQRINPDLRKWREIHVARTACSPDQ